MPITTELIEQRLDFLIANAVNDALTLGLGDDLGGQVIHINSSIARYLNLSIANTLTAEVQIVGQPGPASAQNYHFHIQFVNNQCSFQAGPTTPHWLIGTAGDNSGNVTDIYLLSKDTINLKAASAAGSMISIQLRYTGAVLNNPAVEVLQVAVTVGQNVYAMLKPSPQPVTGTETIHLTTFTDAGAPSPLIATLVQPKTILDDGTAADLLLRLVNTSPEPVTFTPPPDANSPTPTSIHLSVDVHDAAAWALCTAAEADSIVVTPPPHWSRQSGTNDTGQKTWAFRPEYTDTKQIDPHASLEFPIKGVKTTLPPGFTNLYVALREFPNYGTQTVVTQIEKSPLIYNKGKNSGLLSQGTTGANQALRINGVTSGDLMVVEQSGAGSSAHFKGGAGVTIEKHLEVTGDARIASTLVAAADARIERNLVVSGEARIVNTLVAASDARIERNLLVSGDARIPDHTLWFRPGSDLNHGIGWYGPGRPFAQADINGPVAFGHEGGALGTNNNGQNIALRWNRMGQVGIGTIAPKSALSVKGGVAIGSYAETTTAPQNGMTVEGNVGIGTGNPIKAKLQVTGNQLTDTGIFSFLAYRDDMKTPFLGNAGAGGVYNSIWADNRVAGLEFNAFSDARIKNVSGRSNGAQDLATLMQIEITDYTYKDTVSRGNRLQKKVVGQQLLGVYDQALSIGTDIVPDIYQEAELSDGWIDLNTTLTPGDHVKIIPENGSESVVEVIDVEPNRFRVTPGLPDGAVFVFGREVNDFLNVDYDAIAMLNVSATQEIKREKDAEVQALREENAALRARLDHLEKLMERLALTSSAV